MWIFATELRTEAEMRSNSQLRYHANKIISVINMMIENLDCNLSKHKEFLHDLGRKHFNYDVKYEYFWVIFLRIK